MKLSSKEEIQAILGKNLLVARTARGFSQRELGRLVGKHTNQIYWIEYGRHLPSLELVYNLAQVLRVSVDDLLKGEDEARDDS
jgi:transcriptional regulator with XRE-family HTH domain